MTMTLGPWKCDSPEMTSVKDVTEGLELGACSVGPPAAAAVIHRGPQESQPPWRAPHLGSLGCGQGLHEALAWPWGPSEGSLRTWWRLPLGVGPSPGLNTLFLCAPSLG